MGAGASRLRAAGGDSTWRGALHGLSNGASGRKIKLIKNHKGVGRLVREPARLPFFSCADWRWRSQTLLILRRLHRLGRIFNQL